MPTDQVPEQVRKAQNKVQDTYEDSRGRNYDIRQVVKGNERLVTATGMIRDAMLKTCEIKDRDTLRKHIEAQEMLFHLITLYAWAVLKNRYKNGLNIECAELAVARASGQVYQWVMEGNRKPDYRIYTRTSTTVGHRYLDALNTLPPEPPVGPDGEPPEPIAPTSKTIDEMKEHLENLIIRLRDQEKLTEREKEVFCYKLGLCGYDLLEKQGDIAREMNISDAAVSNAFKKGFAVLQDAASKDV